MFVFCKVKLSQIEIGKWTFWGHTKHFVYEEIFATLIMVQIRVAHTSYKTAGEQLAHTRCSDFDPLIHPHVITFCPIRLSKLFWALNII